MFCCLKMYVGRASSYHTLAQRKLCTQNALNHLFAKTDNSPKLEELRKHCFSAKKSISVKIEDAITKEHLEHPFAQGISQANVQEVMRKYLAMSQAFPMIQSGAFLPLIKHSLAENKELSEKYFKAFSVAMFLCNDEMGSHHILSNGGNPRLPEILKTEENSHANMLKKDLHLIFGQHATPDFCPTTRAYLIALSEAFGSQDIGEIVASMVAFENHANRMIKALWQRLEELFPAIDKDSLEYFKIHVGGDDPAEAYHVKMTEQLILETYANQNDQAFIQKVLKYYRLNEGWCREICQASPMFTRTMKEVQLVKE